MAHMKIPETTHDIRQINIPLTMSQFIAFIHLSKGICKIHPKLHHEWWEEVG